MIQTTEAKALAALLAGLPPAPVTSVAGKQGIITLAKADVGLSDVDNTSDIAKPISTAQQTALNLKAPLASPAFTGTPTGITKTHVGLGSVDNTADTAKPVSTAQQTALNLKANLASPTFTGTVSGITATMVGLGSVNNTADTAKPVSTAQQTALNLKANLASPTFTGTVSGITKAMVGLANVDNTSDAAKPVSTAQAAALATKADLVGGVVPTSQIPALSVNEVFVVASEAAMLALTAQRGDMVVRETGRTYVLSSDSPTTLADWKEVLAAGQVTTVAGKTGVVSLVKGDVGLSNVDNTSDANKPVSTATTTALAGKAATIHTHAVADITDATVTGANVLKATDAAAARTAIGAGTSNLVIGTTTGTAADAATLATSLALKAPLASPTFTGTVSGITKAMVGLTNVDNTADTAKPVSTAQQTALDLKAPLANPTFTGTVSGITKTHVGLANVDNTSDAAKPVSTATATALSGKAATVHTHAAADISNSTSVGRSVLTATDATTARTAIGAGTSSLVIGTSAGTAADAAALTASLAGKANTVHTHASADLVDATVVGLNVLKAIDATAARAAIGAGTSNFNDVDLTGAVDGQALVYSATAGKLVASVGTQGVVTSEKNLYVPSESALIRWRADLARTRNGSQQAHIAVIGDSIAGGTGSSSPKLSNSWVARLRTSLDNQYGPAGTGLIPGLNVFRTDASYQNNMTFSGTYGTVAFGLFGKATWRLTPGAYFEVTASNVNEFVVVIASGGNAVLNEITIDGGAVQTVKNWVDTEPIAPNIVPQAGYHSKTMVNVIPAGAVGTHTMRFTRPTSGTGSDAFVFYVEARNNTNGRFRVSSLAGPSESIASFLSPANETTGLTGLNMLDLARPDLLVLGLGINDWQTQVPIATTRARIETIIDRQRSTGTNVGGGAHPGGDAVLLWNPQPDTATLGGGLYTNPTWDAYRQMMYDIALAKDVALIDLGGSWKDYTTANTAGLYNGQIHPNDAGAADMARHIERALTGAGTSGTASGGGGTSNLVIGTTTGTAADAGAVATALASKASVAHTHVATDISDSTATGRSVLLAASATAARTAIGAGTSNLVLGNTTGTAADGGAQATAWATIHTDQVDHVFWNKTTGAWGAVNNAYSVHHFHSENDPLATIPPGVTDLDIWWTA